MSQCFPGLNRLDIRDPRFQRAARAFRQGRVEELPEARQVLATLLDEAESRQGVRRIDIVRRITPEDLARVEGLSATVAAAELGVAPRSVVRARARHRAAAHPTTKPQPTKETDPMQSQHITAFDRVAAFSIEKVMGLVFPGLCVECAKPGGLTFDEGGKTYRCTLCGRAGDLQHYLGKSRGYFAARIYPVAPETYMAALADALEADGPITGPIGAALAEHARK